MKLLITGARGQLGRELQRSLAPLAAAGDVLACDRARLDLTRPDAICETLRRFAPDVVINAAAWTAVDAAEKDAAGAHAINAEAPGVLADECKRLGARLIHYSTDYVFDGKKSSPYLETDRPAPLSAYGRSKLAGEAAITASGATHLIFRTSWVYGLHGANFMKTMLRLGREKNELRVIGDQIGAPTWTRHLAEITALIVARREAPDGLYHLCAAGQTSWYAYAEAIFAEADALGLMPRRPTVRRITSAEYPLPAPRPANSQLDCSRFRRDFALHIPDWRIGLAQCLADAVF